MFSLTHCVWFNYFHLYSVRESVGTELGRNLSKCWDCVQELY